MNIFPLSLFYFWFIGGLNFFVRLEKNVLLFLEEDLAVGLMIKLLFVPLFHDSSILGHGLSLIFRLCRIVYGVIAFIVATILVVSLGVVWLSTPILLVYLLFDPIFPKEVIWGLIGFIFFGLALYLHKIIQDPSQPVWKIKDSSKIWQATKLKKSKITWENLLKTHEIQLFIGSLEIKSDQLMPISIQITPEFEKAVLDLGKQTQARFLTPALFFVASLSQNPNLENELLKLDLVKDDLLQALKYMELKRNRWRRIYIWEEDFAIRHLKGVNRGWLGAPTPELDKVSIDLTREASRVGYPDLLGRQAVVSDVVNILSQEADRNVLLVGEPGSGKSALVRYLAKMIVQGNAPEALATKRVVSLDLSRLISGIGGQGELSERLKNIFEEVSFVEDIIIFIEEIHDLGVGEAGVSMNMQSLLLPYIESSTFQFISSTEIKNYTRIIEKNSAFARLFHKVEVPPASVEETVQIVEERSIDILRHKNIDVTYKAIKILVDLSKKLNHRRVLPDSALTSLSECEVEAANANPKQINTQLVKKVLEQEVNVPILELNPDHKELLLNLESIIKQRLIDQDEAVTAVSNTLRRSATSLREGTRPIGSFLFVGPTGTGKTELAKTIAEVYFGQKGQGAFVRFDMSEYQNPESVNRLIGDSNQEGQLTEAVKNKPYCLILLDEFEKANSKILTLFLQVLEDGRLTDASGQTIDFTNTIIIATSNAGSLKIAEGLGKSYSVAQMQEEVKQDLLTVFSPELINRFDGVIIFKPLSTRAIEQIVNLKLKSLQEMLKKQGFLINFAPDVIEELTKKGYDPVLGARPLRRLIQDTIEARLSVMILEGKLPKGESFTVDAHVFNE